MDITQIIKDSGGNLIGTHAPGSAEWHAQRSNAIGGSDIAPIMNKSPWTSQFTLWAEKTGNLLPRESTMAMKLGNYFEPAIARLFSDNHPELKLHSNNWTFAWEYNPAFHANPDAILEDKQGNLSILEIKFSRNPMPVLPEHYKLQVLWYMQVTGLHTPAVLCAVAGGEYREFVIEWDKELVYEMVQQSEDFLMCVSEDMAPNLDGSDSTYETVRAIHPDIKDEEIDLDRAEFQLLLDAIDMQKVWEQQVNLRKSGILKAMQGNKYGRVDGESVVMLQARGEGKPFLKITGR
jgi:putative phage-type endonuclease